MYQSESGFKFSSEVNGPIDSDMAAMLHSGSQTVVHCADCECMYINSDGLGAADCTTKLGHICEYIGAKFGHEYI